MATSSFSATAKAEGVDYFTVPGADLRMFRCEALELTLSTRGCADRWARGQDLSADAGSADDDRNGLNACARCPIGAAHSGRAAVHYMPAFASIRCPRCSFGRRIIGNRVCVSCYNRERELVRGRNTRGNRPKLIPSMITMPVRTAVDGHLAPPRLTTVASPHETRVRTGNKDKRGKPEYFPSPHPRGGTVEAAMQVLRLRRGLVDLLPITSIPEVALQPELPWP